MKNEKISIIIPVYNVYKYIRECIESLINQTYSNIEIILVDDGSNDNSGKICDDYAKKDKRIKVIHKENSGVSNSRNVGIEISSGDYIVFVDSDDVVSRDYIKKLFERHNDKRQIICKFIEFNKEIPNIKLSGNITQIKKDSFIEISKLSLLNTPCCKLYNKKIIKDNKILFDENISIGEDLLFNLEYLKYINEVYILDEYLYYYRRSETNTLTTKYNEKSMDMYIKTYDVYTDFFNKKIKEEDLEHYDTTRIYMIIAIIQNEFKNKKISMFKRILNAKKILRNKKIKERIKVLKHTSVKSTYFLLLHNMCLIYKVVDKIRNVIKK